jgi:hypothetical protein
MSKPSEDAAIILTAIPRALALLALGFTFLVLAFSL